MEKRNQQIKSFLIGLPLFNAIVIAAWAGLGALELYLFPVTETSAPITFVGVFVILLIMGGYAVCGLIFGIYKTRKYTPGWKGIALQTALLVLLIYGLYLLFYFFFTNDHSYIFRDTSIIAWQQIAGYLLGCGIGKLTKLRRRKDIP